MVVDSIGEGGNRYVHLYSGNVIGCCRLYRVPRKPKKEGRRNARQLGREIEQTTAKRLGSTNVGCHEAWRIYLWGEMVKTYIWHKLPRF